MKQKTKLVKTAVCFIYVLLFAIIGVAAANNEESCVVLENGEQDCTPPVQHETTFANEESEDPVKKVRETTADPEPSQEKVGGSAGLSTESKSAIEDANLEEASSNELKVEANNAVDATEADPPKEEVSDDVVISNRAKQRESHGNGIDVTKDKEPVRSEDPRVSSEAAEESDKTEPQNGRGENVKKDEAQNNEPSGIQVQIQAVEEAQDRKVPLAEQACPLYIAKSTIPNSGLGMFSGVEFENGDNVWPGDPVFPVIDLKYHQSVLGPKVYKKKDYSLNPPKDYQWYGPAMAMDQESAHPYVYPKYLSAYAPGMTASLNCHMALNNVDSHGIPHYDIGGLHRSKDPGSGAFTPYYNCENRAQANIPAGGEIFIHYGDGYFESRTYKYGELPLPKHYHFSDILSKKYSWLIGSVMETGLWELMIRYKEYIPSEDYRRLIGAMPRTKNELATVLERSIRDVHQPTAIRSTAELDKIGRCVGRLRTASSTIAQAGRGAFLTQPVRRGDIVTTTPVLFTPTDDFFNMYEGDWDTKKSPPNKEVIVHKQIAYNYCLHHNESSVYLCPYGIGVNYINHGTGAAANVKMQWLKDGELGHNSTLLDVSPVEMIGTANPPIFLDYVAVRDIEEGEEILLDYGDAWQHAWDQHVARFERIKEAMPEDYQSARDWSNANEDAMLRTEKEQEEDPYPAHFDLKCIVLGLSVEKLVRKWKGSHVPAMPCRIIKRKKNIDGKYLYSVLYKNIHVDSTGAKSQTIEGIEKMEWTEHEEWLPREAFRFWDKAYTTDLLLPHALRQPIGLPDNLMPEAWRNVVLHYEEVAAITKKKNKKKST